jgi:hypothetical protein
MSKYEFDHRNGPIKLKGVEIGNPSIILTFEDVENGGKEIKKYFTPWGLLECINHYEEYHQLEIVKGESEEKTQKRLDLFRKKNSDLFVKSFGNLV